MKYVFDSSSLIKMKHIYPKIFPSLWKLMDQYAEGRDIISVSEVYNEVSLKSDIISDWAIKNKSIFEIPEAEEYDTIKDILAKHKE